MTNSLNSKSDIVTDQQQELAALCYCVELAPTVTEVTNLNAVQRPYNPLSPIIKPEKMYPLFRQRIEERDCGQTRSVPELS